MLKDGGKIQLTSYIKEEKDEEKKIPLSLKILKMH